MKIRLKFADMRSSYITALFIAASVFVATCAVKKTAGVVKPQAETPSLLEVAKGIDSTATQATLDLGKQILTTNCARCHSAKDPLKFSSEEWKKDMERMIVKSKMTQELASPLRLYTAAILKQAGK
jgi:cytochrome c5